MLLKLYWWKLFPHLFKTFIIHQIHYEKSDWSRAFNQFTIACELDMINAMSAADIAFIMSSSTSAWLLSPLECSPQKQIGWMLCFYFWGWIMSKMYNKTIIEFVFRTISWLMKTLCLCYLPQPSASADNTDLGFDNSWYHAQPHPIIVYYYMYTSDSLLKSWLVESIQSIHNSLWTSHDKCNICCRYCIYHVKFNVCLVTKPLGVFSSETKWLNSSLLFLRMKNV